MKPIPSVKAESGAAFAKRRQSSYGDEEMKDGQEALDTRKTSPYKKDRASPWKGSPSKKQSGIEEDDRITSNGISASEAAFAKRLKEEQLDELMNKTQVRSAQLVIRDNDSVSMCFYSDAQRSNQISKSKLSDIPIHQSVLTFAVLTCPSGRINEA